MVKRRITRPHRLIAAAAWVVASAVLSAGQTAQPQTAPDVAALRDAARVTEPAARARALDDFIARFPESSRLVDVYTLKLAALQAISPIDLAAVDAAVAKARSVKTPRTPHEVLNLLAMTLTADAVLSRAESLAREAIGSIDEASYVRDWEQRYPTRASEAKSRYQGDASRYRLVLGRILVKEGRDADAKAAFEQSLALVPLQGSAALALASLAEKAGDAAEAYRQLAWAAITGRLSAGDRSRLLAAYVKTHPDGTSADVAADLDRLFRASFANPIAPPGRYAPSPARTTRVALAEMFTGAGCVPCLSVDLSLETMLERYSRDELVVLMYHIHAPSPDPLSNASVQARSEYYGVNGAPTTFIDGVKEVAEGPREDAPEVYRRLDALVARRLEAAPAATLELSASMRGSVVTADARVNGIALPSPDLRLQLALVERLVRYSGENGERFHPMVVRALGGDKAGGFALDGANGETSVTQAFDLEALGTQNLRYYDDYALDMKSRLGLTVTFLEYKHAIESGNVAVVAFVQDVKTRRVLQATFVTPAVEARRPVVFTAALADPARPAAPGDRIEVRLTARLEAGWHVYAITPATPQGPTATVISIPDNQPFTLAGPIDQPPPRVAYDANFDRDTMFFEDEVTFGVPVRVGAGAKAGAHSVALSVAYQMCDARICLPPTQAIVSAPVTIR